MGLNSTLSLALFAHHTPLSQVAETSSSNLPDRSQDRELTLSDLARVIEAGHAPYSLLATHLLLFLKPLLALLDIRIPDRLSTHLVDSFLERSQDKLQDRRVP